METGNEILSAEDRELLAELRAEYAAPRDAFSVRAELLAERGAAATARARAESDRPLTRAIYTRPVLRVIQGGRA